MWRVKARPVRCRARSEVRQERKRNEDYSGARAAHDEPAGAGAAGTTTVLDLDIYYRSCKSRSSLDKGCGLAAKDSKRQLGASAERKNRLLTDLDRAMRSSLHAARRLTRSSERTRTRVVASRRQTKMLLMTLRIIVSHCQFPSTKAITQPYSAHELFRPFPLHQAEAQNIVQEPAIVIPS